MSTREKIVGLIVGTIGALMLAAGTASLANFGARVVNILSIILGLVWFAFGVRAVQKKDRQYFFTLHGLSVFGFVVCTCFFGYFLFAGQRWAYGSITTRAATINYYDVSAYRYYFIWSGAQRDAENRLEADLYDELWNVHDLRTGQPLAVTQLGADTNRSIEDSRPKSLSDKEGINIGFATLGALATLLFCSLPLLKRFMPKTLPDALDPVAATHSFSGSPCSPKAGGEFKSASEDGGSTLGP